MCMPKRQRRTPFWPVRGSILSPLATAWGDKSLVAQASDCSLRPWMTVAIPWFLSQGDMLPLQSFAGFESFYEETRLSVQPR